MHHPEIYCLFERDNGIRPLVSKEKLEAILDGIIFIILFAFFIILVYDITESYFIIMKEYVDTQTIIMMTALTGFLMVLVFNDL